MYSMRPHIHVGFSSQLTGSSIGHEFTDPLTIGEGAVLVVAHLLLRHTHSLHKTK